MVIDVELLIIILIVIITVLIRGWLGWGGRVRNFWQPAWISMGSEFWE